MIMRYRRNGRGDLVMQVTFYPDQERRLPGRGDTVQFIPFCAPLTVTIPIRTMNGRKIVTKKNKKK